MTINGSCLCGKINFTIDTTPNEIAVCHCRICQQIHKQNITKFAKCSIKNIKVSIDTITEPIY